MFGMQMGRMGQTGAASWLQTFNSLYANGEQGIAKLDFSDFTGMYQDRARTIPYTAVEQPLGSFTGLNGVTATAPADVNRGVVSARVNLAPNSAGVGFSTSAGAIQTGAPGSAPDGVGASSILVPNATASYHNGYFQRTDVVGRYFIQGKFKKKEYKEAGFCDAYAGQVAVVFDLDSGLEIFRGGYIASATIAPAENGFVLITVITNEIPNPIVSLGVTTGPDGGTFTHFGSASAGDGASGVYFADVDFRPLSQAHLPYQRVNTATDYDTAGFPHYLAFNGINTAYVTPSIDFTGTDKMTVWAGVTRLSNVVGFICELSNQSFSNNGAFSVIGPASPAVEFSSRGTALVDFAQTGHTPPENLVITAYSDISASNAVLRVNTVQTVNNGSQGTGNYGNYPFYIGARAGIGSYLNGRLYSLIVLGAATPLPQIEAVETLIRQKMRLP